ncbi:helix-turn-helix domain-containing protein [Labilibacter sediminis]|nr:helix-turn-helix domain-containing protein [Labilibacter sediminis]
MNDQNFLKRVKEVINSNLSDENFGVNELSHKMGLSRSQLFRKLKQVTNSSASTLIRDLRLEEAEKLLKEENEFTISEIAYKVGFSSPSYFNKCFNDKYGCAPGEHVKKESLINNSIIEDKEKKDVSIKKILYPAVAIALLIVLLIIIGKKRNTTVYSSPTQEASIAVLPFLDLSPDSNREYLAMGITDAIILELSKINNLRVISRGSAEYAQDSIKHYPKIAQALNIKLILEGSVVCSNDSLRVNAQLIEALPEEKHLWAKKYEQASLDIFKLTSNISQSVAKEIQPVLASSTANDPVTAPPAIADLYLKANHLWQQQSPQSLKAAVALLNQSMQIDSSYAPAYCLLAECYISLNKFIRNNEEKLKNRQAGRAAIDQALDKAIQLDGSLAEVYITKGNILGKFDYNWEGMRQLVEMGLQLNPNNTLGYIALCQYYLVKGNLSKSLETAMKAEALDPLNPRTCSMVAQCYTFAGKYEKAIEQYTYVLDMFPSYGFAWDGIGYAHYMMGNKQKALESWTELHRFIGNDDLVSYYEKESFDKSIAYWLNNTTSGEKLYCSNPVIIAMVHLFINDSEGAMEYIEFAYKYKDLDLPLTILLPNFKSLYGNPRFRAIAEQIGVTFAESHH